MKKQTVAFPVEVAVPWSAEPKYRRLEAGFIRQLLGLASILTFYRMWDGTDEEIQIVQEQVQKGLQDLMLDACCPDAVVSVARSKGGYMVATQQNGDKTFLNSVYNSAFYDTLNPTQATDNTDNNICAGVRMLVERLLEDILYSLDQAQFAADTGQAFAQGLSALADLLTLGAFPLEDVYDGAQEFFFAATDLGISALKLAFSDPAVRDKMVENLYCAIANASPKLLTDEMYFDAVADLPLLAAQSNLLEFFLRGFSTFAEPNWDRIYGLYNLGALSSDPTCEEEFQCVPGWILEADLTLTDGGLTVQAGASNNGVWVSGTGWTAATSFASGQYHKNMNLEAFFPEATYTGAGMTFTQEWGNIPGGSELWWVLGAGDHAFEIITNNVAPESPWDVTGAEHTGDRALFVIPVGVSGDPDPGGFATMTKARLYGVGEPPTIEGWELIG